MLIRNCLRFISCDACVLNANCPFSVNHYSSALRTFSSTSNMILSNYYAFSYNSEGWEVRHTHNTSEGLDSQSFGSDGIYDCTSFKVAKFQDTCVVRSTG